MKSKYLILGGALVLYYLYSKKSIASQVVNVPQNTNNNSNPNNTPGEPITLVSTAVIDNTPQNYHLNFPNQAPAGGTGVQPPSAADLHSALSPLALSLLMIPTLTQTHVGGSTSSTFSDTSSGKDKVNSFSPATAAQVSAAAAAVNNYLQQQAYEKTTALSRVMNVSNYSGPTQYKASCKVASGYVTLSYTTYSQAAYAKGNVILSNYANQGAVSTSKLPHHY